MAPEKPMSDRLAGMKFMARFVASESPKSGPSTPEGRPNKRARYSNGWQDSSPSTPSADQLAIDAFAAKEEEKRSQAIDRQAAEAGETRWELSVRDVVPSAQELRIVHAGFAELDSANPGFESSDDDAFTVKRVPGRMVFGKQPTPTKRTGSDNCSSSGQDSESFDEDEDEDPADALIRKARKEAAHRAREERHAEKRAANAESRRLADNRRKKDVNLNRVTSISSAGGGAGSPRSGSSQIKCYNCGETGHRKIDCLRPPRS